MNIDQVINSIYPNQDPTTILFKLEQIMESDLIENLFPRLSIQATTKKHPKSLPYQHEIIHCLYTESYLNGVFEYKRCYRKFVQEILKQDIYKLRFYINITPEGKKLNYSFRYYVHKK